MGSNATAVQRHLVTVGGTQVEYLVAGQGPDVVLLHGLGDSADDWRGVMTELATSYRVYAPTLPGFGGDRRAVVDAGEVRDLGDADGRGSDHDTSRAHGASRSHNAVEDPSAESFARFCNAFIDEKDLEHPIIGGHSLGGLIALQAALDRPDRPRALVLVASAGLGRAVTPALRAAALPVFGDVAAQASRWWPGAALRAVSRAPLLFGRPWRTPWSWLEEQYRLAQDGRFMETNLRALRLQVGLGGQRRVVLDALSAISLPTLVVWGSADHVVPAAQGRAAVARLPAGRLEVLAGLGHVPHIEDPRRFASVIRRFFDTLT